MSAAWAGAPGAGSRVRRSRAQGGLEGGRSCQTSSTDGQVSGDLLFSVKCVCFPLPKNVSLGAEEPLLNSQASEGTVLKSIRGVNTQTLKLDKPGFESQLYSSRVCPQAGGLTRLTLRFTF